MTKNRARYLQGLLHANGYTISIDGAWVKNSQSALNSFASDNGFKVRGKGEVSSMLLSALRRTVPKRTKAIVSRKGRNSVRSTVDGLPRSTDYNGMLRFYGHPKTGVPSKLIKIIPAYPLFFGKTKVSGVTVHEKCAKAFTAVFEEILAVYGVNGIERLGLDKYSGAYNQRKIRGGTAWSTHAFGCAIDMHASGNEMRKSWCESLFSKPEYDKFVAIWLRHGFINLGKSANFDSMHFQWANI